MLNLPPRYSRGIPRREPGVRRILASCFARILVFVLVLVLLLCDLPAIDLPAIALAAPISGDSLTLDILKQRLVSPVPGTPLRVINLRRFAIDLRPENATFRDAFYRSLAVRLAETPTIGLDLSYSVIQGDFDLSQLGQRVPLYSNSLTVEGAVQDQLQRDRRRLLQLQQLSRTLLGNLRSNGKLTTWGSALTLVQTRFDGPFNASNTFFLGLVQARGATFNQGINAIETRFSRSASFASAQVTGTANFRNSLFLDRASFSQAQFQGPVIFQNSEFKQEVGFNQTQFQGDTNLSRTQFLKNADFSQTRWKGLSDFSRGRFAQALFLTNASFSQAVLFRQAQFSRLVNLRGASLQAAIDFNDASFACKDIACRQPRAYVNVAELQFDSPGAIVLGSPGRIGRVLSIPTLQGNESVLRSLISGFRLKQQVADANQVEYMAQKLRLQSLWRELLGVNINSAPALKLTQVGFSDSQVASILETRETQGFRNLSDLLNLDSIDLATYVKVRETIVTSTPASIGEWIVTGLAAIGLSLVLLLSRYGSDVWLVFGVGVWCVVYFAGLFWLADRLRPPKVLPGPTETIAMVSSLGGGFIGGASLLLGTAEQPGLTLACLMGVLGPVPIVLLGLLLQQVWRSDGPLSSYLVEDGSFRQVRILIGRLPTVPRYPLFRDRYMPILWERRWGWLNYYDFSLLNWFRLGVNDLRLRDNQVPGYMTALVWYQWVIGLLYVALLLWTLSRTIPGLNLLIYFR